MRSLKQSKAADSNHSMSDIVSSRLQRRISFFRWLITALVLSLALIHLTLEISTAIEPAYWEPLELSILFIGALSSWWILSYLRRSVKENEAAELALRQAYKALNEANDRQSYLLQVNRQLMEAEDEESLLDVILELPLKLVPAAGCALIRFDERGQALPAIFRGDLPARLKDGWETSLSVSAMRQHCQACEACAKSKAVECPLVEFKLPGEDSSTGAGDSGNGGQIIYSYCLPLERGGRELGMLSIFLLDNRHPGVQELLLLQLLGREIARALESDALRSREIHLIYQLRNLRHVSNLYSDLARTLERIVDLMEAEGGVLFLLNEETGETWVQAEVGRSLGQALDLVQAMSAGADNAEGPMLVRDLEQDEIGSVRSLLIAPMRTEQRVLGSLVLWASKPDSFSRRWARVMATMARQAALMLENQHLYMRDAHRAAMAERARLAGEIHDGLAQTLGYLKLRASQLANWQLAGEREQVSDGLNEVRHLLDEAYQDAREAIDGLRLQAADVELGVWVDEAVGEFEDISQIPVASSPPPKVTLPPEVHSQLQRIVQETLSNIRKHAGATAVTLEWEIDDFWLTLRICDNGHGFDIDDLPASARHGLKIMHERVDLLDGELKILSEPGQGAEINIRLPLRNMTNRVEHARTY